MIESENQETENAAPPAKGLLHLTLRQGRKLVVGIIGGTIVLIGVIMFVTPGPAMVMIPLGLAILATEFIWARRLLNRLKKQTQDTLDYWKNGQNKKS